VLLRNLIISALLLFCTVSTVFGIEVSVTSLSYLQEKNFIEIYSRIMGSSVSFMETDGLSKQSQVELLVMIKNGDEILVGEKLNIASPKAAESLDFWDVRRYSIEPGSYDLSLQYVDLNNLNDTLFFDKVIEVGAGVKPISSSNLLLLSDVEEKEGRLAFNKAGFYFEPLSYNVFGTEDNDFHFYTEIYDRSDSKLEQTLYYSFKIKDAETNEEITKAVIKKFNLKATVQVFESFDISEVPSGNYIFQFDVVNKSQESLCSMKEHFSVYHPTTDYRNLYQADELFETSFVQILDEEELNYGLKAVFPRLKNNYTSLANSIIKDKDLNAKRYFLYNYWSQYSSTNSKEVYEKYMDVAHAIDIKYANNVGHGFETDRGYIFLKYGRPDDAIEVPDEPSAPPYEIWIYNHLPETNQTAVKFLFYNPSLSGNDFELLHSTCRGEISNPQWEIELYRDDPNSAIGNSIDARRITDGLNRNARRYFNDF